MTWRLLVIRVVAGAACLVALLGLVSMIVAWQRLNQAEAALQTRVREIGDTVAHVSASLETVSGSAGSAAATLEEARGSLQSGATATSGAADALGQLARSLAFLGVGGAFDEQADQLATLAVELDQTGAALDQNADDLRRIGQEAGRTAADTRRLAAQIHQLAGDENQPGGLSQVFGAIRLIAGGGIVVLLLTLFGIGASLYLLTAGGRGALIPPSSEATGEAPAASPARD